MAWSSASWGCCLIWKTTPSACTGWWPSGQGAIPHRGVNVYWTYLYDDRLDTFEQLLSKRLSLSSLFPVRCGMLSEAYLRQIARRNLHELPGTCMWNYFLQVNTPDSQQSRALMLKLSMEGTVRTVLSLCIISFATVLCQLRLASTSWSCRRSRRQNNRTVNSTCCLHLRRPTLKGRRRNQLTSMNVNVIVWPMELDKALLSSPISWMT